MTKTSRGTIKKREWMYCDEHGSPKRCAEQACRNGKKRSAYVFSILVYENGTRRRVRKQFPTKAEAEAELEKFKEQEKRPKPESSPASDVTLDAYADRWLAEIATHLERRTVQSYREMLKRHIRPTLGGRRLAEIQRTDLKSLLSEKRAAGLSKNTVRLIRATASVLFADAVDDNIVATNPAHGIARKGRKRADAHTPTERRQSIRPMTYEQLATFLRAAERPRWDDANGNERELRDLEKRRDLRDYALFLTLADTGVRPGEAVALKWSDVDVAGRTLRIERALSRGEIKSTKTGETRKVDLTARLADVVSRWRAEARAAALAAGRDEPPAWVFPSEAGTPLDAINLARRFRALLGKANVPRFRLYDLRHTFATHLLGEGAPITYVAAQLGHAKPTTTLAFYAHWLPRGDKALIDRLEAARQAAAVSALAQGGRKNSERVGGVVVSP